MLQGGQTREMKRRTSWVRRRTRRRRWWQLGNVPRPIGRRRDRHMQLPSCMGSVTSRAQKLIVLSESTTLLSIKDLKRAVTGPSIVHCKDEGLLNVVF